MFYNQLYQGGIRAILDADNTIFNNMVVPRGINLSDVVDNIIFKYGDAPLMVPDPAVMKYYIKNWSRKRIAQWQRFLDAVNLEYDPIENYDRREERSSQLQHGHTIKTDDDLKHGENIKTDDDLTHGLTVENQISADNATTYQADSKGVNSGQDQRDISEAHSGTDERDISEAHSGTDTTTETSRIHGNIGVTTSQQMLQSELDLIPALSLIDYITEDFHTEFCLYVYN